jgi:hypothetical protein
MGPDRDDYRERGGRGEYILHDEITRDGLCAESTSSVDHVTHTPCDVTYKEKDVVVTVRTIYMIDCYVPEACSGGPTVAQRSPTRLFVVIECRRTFANVGPLEDASGLAPGRSTIARMHSQ